MIGSTRFLSKRHMIISYVMLVLIGTFLSPSNVKAQANIFFCGYTDRDMGEMLCNYTQQSSFASSADAEKAVDQILEPLGLPRNFVLVSCPRIDNAIAITPDDGLRYIVYDNEFISKLHQGNTDWAAMSILAHELGHHLCGHTLRSSQSLEEQRKKELEADEFSGFIMEKLGASLPQAQIAVSNIASEGDDSYSTHPNKEKRLASIEKGYLKAGGQKIPDHVDETPGAEAFYHLGNERYSNNDFQGAIQAYTQAIETNPDFAVAFYSRGQVKRTIKDYQGATADFNEALRLKPDYPEVLYYRGMVAYRMANYTGCISDLNRVIETLPQPEALAFFYRGMAREQLNDLKGAFSDLSNAIAIKPEAEFYINRGLVRYKMNNFQGAVEDYTMALQLDPTLEMAFYNRSFARLNIGDTEGAAADLNHWLLSHPEDDEARLTLGLAYLQGRKFEMAKQQFTDIIKAKPNHGKAYFYRGQANKDLFEFENALSDYNQAEANGFRNADLYYARGNMNYQLRNMEPAIADLTKAIEFDPDRAELYYLRGLSYQIWGDDGKMCIDLKTSCSKGYQQACSELATLCK
jgi:tetratricopeptide (TPR) repeat protein